MLGRKDSPYAMTTQGGPGGIHFVTRFRANDLKYLVAEKSWQSREGVVTKKIAGSGSFVLVGDGSLCQSFQGPDGACRSRRA